MQSYTRTSCNHLVIDFLTAVLENSFYIYCKKCQKPITVTDVYVKSSKHAPPPAYLISERCAASCSSNALDLISTYSYEIQIPFSLQATLRQTFHSFPRLLISPDS